MWTPPYPFPKIRNKTSTVTTATRSPKTTRATRASHLPGPRGDPAVRGSVIVRAIMASRIVGRRPRRYGDLNRSVVGYDTGCSGADEFNQMAVDWFRAKLGLCEGCR